jgi:alkanesulfonate monooxygenase
LNPRPDPDLLPRILMSGASPAARRVQRELGATRLAYPLAAGAAVDGDADALRDTGIGLGILARPDAEAAWAVAHQRFPHDEMGEEMHDWSAREVESHWHINLSRAATRTQSAEKTYWLYPFRSSRTFCPYLVGSYADVAHVLRGYFDRGVTAIVLDGLMRPEDLPHLRVALGQAGADEAHVAGQPSGGAEVHVE